MLQKLYLKPLISLERLLIKTKYKYQSITRFYHNIDGKVSAVTLQEMKQTLKSTNTSFVDGHACITAFFPLCDDSRRKECKLYINKMTGS